MAKVHLYWVFWCWGTCTPARALCEAGYPAQHAGDQLFHSVRLSSRAPPRGCCHSRQPRVEWDTGRSCTDTDVVLQGPPDVTNECLDILNEVITKYGSLMTQQHAQLTGALLPLLDDRRSPMRKRAIGCLGESGLLTAGLTGPLVFCKHSHCTHACLARTPRPSDA